MKKNLICTLLIGTVFFASCSKSDVEQQMAQSVKKENAPSSSIKSDNFQTMVVLDKTFSGAEIFRGLFLSDGRVAEIIPELEPLHIKHFITTPEDIAQYKSFESEVIAKISLTDPQFFVSFGTAMRSGDPIVIQGALETGSEKYLRTLEELGIRVDSDDVTEEAINGVNDLADQTPVVSDAEGLRSAISGGGVEMATIIFKKSGIAIYKTMAYFIGKVQVSFIYEVETSVFSGDIIEKLTAVDSRLLQEKLIASLANGLS